MSKENVKAFFEKAQQDETIKKQLLTVQCELHRQMMNFLSDNLVELGAQSGLEFTADDLREMHKTLMDPSNENRELSDDELNAIAGGFLPVGNGALIPLFFPTGT